MTTAAPACPWRVSQTCAAVEILDQDAGGYNSHRARVGEILDQDAIIIRTQRASAYECSDGLLCL